MGGAVALIAAAASMTNSSMADNAGGQCGGGLFVATLLKPSSLELRSKEADSRFNMSRSTMMSNRAGTGAGICSKQLEDLLVGDEYNPHHIYDMMWSSKNGDATPVRGVSAINMVNSVFLNNTGGEGWDVYADNTTSIVFDVGVNIHMQSASVLWRRNCTIGEVPTGDGSCLACGAFSYSLSAGGSCIQCNASAQCPGGALITPLPGFWHAAGGNDTRSNPRCSLGNVTRCAH